MLKAFARTLFLSDPCSVSVIFPGLRFISSHNGLFPLLIYSIPHSEFCILTSSYDNNNILNIGHAHIFPLLFCGITAL